MKKIDFARIGQGVDHLSQPDLNSIAKELALQTELIPNSFEITRNILANIQDIKFAFFLANAKRSEIREVAIKYILQNRSKEIEAIIRSFEKHENAIFEIGSFDGYDQVVHELLSKNNVGIALLFLDSKSVVGATLAERQASKAVKLSSNVYDEAGYVEAVSEGHSLMKVPTSKSVYFIRDRDIECHVKLRPYAKEFVEAITNDVKNVKIMGNYSITKRTFQPVKALSQNQLNQLILQNEILVDHDLMVTDRISKFLNKTFGESDQIPKELILKRGVNGVRYTLNNSTLLEGISDKADQHKAKVASLALLAALSLSPNEGKAMAEHERFASSISEVSRIDGSGHGAAYADLIDVEVKELRRILGGILAHDGTLKIASDSDENREIRTSIQVLENRRNELLSFNNDESITKLRNILANVERMSGTIKLKLKGESRNEIDARADLTVIQAKAKDITELLANRRVFGSYGRTVKL